MSRLAPALKTFPYGSFGLAVAIGAGGGALFAVFSLPLAWMLGAMTFSVIAVQLKLPLSAPAVVRPPMSAIIGVMLGSGFTPEILHSVPGWIGPMLGALGFLAVAGLLGTIFYSKVAGYDLRTAFFCGMPGGLVEMLTLADHYGADLKRIALVHSGRVFFTIMTLPFLIEFLTGTKVATTPNAGVTLADIGAVNAIWFAGTAILGTILGRMARLPAYYLLGPMLLSMVVHGAGWTSFKPPFELIVMAQIVIGTIVGCRFSGASTRALGEVFFFSAIFAIFLVLVAFLFAHTVAMLTGHSPVSLLLAYSPAGAAEMGLIALARGVEVTMVTAHHILRVVAVSVGAGVIARHVWSDAEREG